jgi:hypothetical protein
VIAAIAVMASVFAVRAKTKFSFTINAILPVQSSRKKYSDCPVGQITCTSFSHSVPKRGALAIVTNVGTGCDGRDGGARRAALLADGEDVWS